MATFDAAYENVSTLCNDGHKDFEKEIKNIIFRFNLVNNSNQVIGYSFGPAIVAIPYSNMSDGYGIGDIYIDDNGYTFTCDNPNASYLSGMLGQGSRYYGKFEFESGKNQMLQAGSATLLTVGGQPVNFWFWTHSSNTKQNIDICPSDYYEITECTSSHSIAEGKGFSITLNGSGTDNICITIDSNNAYDITEWVGYYGQNTYSSGEEPPALSIQVVNINEYQVKLNETVIQNWTYDATNSNLSWGSADNSGSAANLSFSLNSEAQQTFTGTLQTITSSSSSSGTFAGIATLCTDPALDLGQWVGTYSQCQYSAWKEPPNLTIQAAANNSYQVLLSGSTIKDWTYDPSSYQLSWTSTGGNWSEAMLLFSQDVSRQATFQGTLDMVPPKYTCTGTFSGTRVESPNP